jgi:hypothetical protein
VDSLYIDAVISSVWNAGTISWNRLQSLPPIYLRIYNSSHLCPLELIPLSRIVPGKLMLAEMVMKFVVFYGTRRYTIVEFEVLTQSSPLKDGETSCSSETSADSQRTTRRYLPEEITPQCSKEPSTTASSLEVESTGSDVSSGGFWW